MNIETQHGSRDNVQGWIRLSITIVVWVVTAVWFTRGLQDNVEAQSKQSAQLLATITVMTDRMDRAVETLQRIEVQQAKANQHLEDNDRRIQRLESIHDGGSGGGHRP